MKKVSLIGSDRKDSNSSLTLDYLSFQERAMGGNHRLRFHKPIPKIAFKEIEGSKVSQCEMQYLLRLWNCGTRQTIMFFANMSSTDYKEYNSALALKPNHAIERLLD